MVRTNLKLRLRLAFAKCSTQKRPVSSSETGKIEGCETHEEVIARSSDFFNDMILPNEKKYQHIAVFSHGAWIHSLLTYIYQREIKEYWHAPRQENCGVTTIEIEDGVCHVLKESEIFYNKDGE